MEIKEDKVKFSFDELIKDYKIIDKEVFRIYLKEIWKELSVRSEHPNLGINKTSFSSVNTNI